MARNTQDLGCSKSPVAEIEYAEPESQVEKKRADYSGARAKSDPAEIALVRKLDRRILPMLWAMYFLNYVSYLEKLQLGKCTDFA